jgi:Zn-dependent alcohol dehydrogenase
MKAAVLTALNAPLELCDVEPDALDYGQVRVRVLASGICGAQLAEIRGEKGNAGHVPHLLGHEGCGIVEYVGDCVTRVKVGDKVVMHWRKAAGIESPLPRYRIGREWRTSGRVVTFTEVANVSENRLTPVPANTPTELCALLGCGLSTALATIEREARILPGESLMIVGLGGLGVNLLRAARLAHAAPIVCVDVRESKRKVAEAAGAVFAGEGDSLRATLDACGCGCGCDAVIDTSGNPGAIGRALPFVAPSGRFVMIGQPPPGAAVPMTDAAAMFAGEGKSIRATQGGGFRPDLDIPRYLRLWQSGALSVEGIVTHRVPLAEINRGIDMVRAGEASRVIVKIQ